MTINVSKSTCIAQITAAAVNRRVAFLVEMAVGMTVYATHGKVNKASRADLYDIYRAAGYDCATADGADYRTVHRRATASATLFEHATLQSIEQWADGQHGAGVVRAITENISHLDVATIRGVLALADKTPAAELPELGAPAPEKTRIELGHIHVVIDDGATPDELKALVRKIRALIKEKLAGGA